MSLEVDACNTTLRGNESWDAADFFNSHEGRFRGAIATQLKMSREDIVNKLCKHKMLRLRQSVLDLAFKKDNQLFSLENNVTI